MALSSIEQRFRDYLKEGEIKGLLDRNGQTFTARTDAVFDGIVIELKEHELNNVRTIAASANKLSAQLAYRIPYFRDHPEDIPDCPNVLSSKLWDMGFFHDCLKWGFNHSAYKNSIVAKHLASQGRRMIIVFAKHPSHMEWRRKKLPFKQYYKEVFGLEVMLESEFWQAISSKAA